MTKLIVYIDGGSRGNPGPGGIGVVICDERNKILKKYSSYLADKVTNNEAEYQALIFALKKIKLLFGKKKTKNFEILIKSDSQLLVEQLQGRYKILEKNLQTLFLEAWNLKLDFKKIKFLFIRREENTIADSLVNEALDEVEKQKKLQLFS